MSPSDAGLRAAELAAGAIAIPARDDVTAEIDEWSKHRIAVDQRLSPILAQIGPVK